MVFRFLQPYHLAKARLTCRMFAILAGQFIFSQITLPIQRFPNYLNWCKLGGQKQGRFFTRNTQRLGFLSTMEVSPLVRVIRFRGPFPSTWYTASRMRRNQARSLDFLAGMLQTINQFPNLCTLRLENVDFFDHDLSHFIITGPLRRLEVQGGCFPRAPLVWIKAISLEIQSPMMPDYEVAFCWQWLNVVDRRDLQSLSLVLTNADYAAFFLRRLASEPTLPLTSLTIPEAGYCVELLARLSHQLSTLQNLTITSYYVPWHANLELPTFSPISLPALEVYDGPAEIFSILRVNGELRSLQIRAFQA